jgi:hypothetical protein
MESAILRAQKFAEKDGEESAARFVDMASVFCNDAIQRVETAAKNTIAAMTEGDEMRTLLVALKRFTKNNSPVNTIAARQRIANTLIQANKYVFCVFFVICKLISERHYMFQKSTNRIVCSFFFIFSPSTKQTYKTN